MKWTRVLIVSILAATLAACGFHLRGRFSLSDRLSTIVVESSDVALRELLVDALETSGSTVVENPASAKAILRLVDVNYERRVRTIDSRGKVNGYLLVYSANFAVETSGGDELRGLSPISLRRDFNFDSTQVLQKEDEERDLRRDMERDMAQQIVRQLSRIAAAPTPVKHVAWQRIITPEVVFPA